MNSRSCGLVQRIGTVGFARATPRPQRGTSPSPREVFDRATFSHSPIGHRSTTRHVSPVESRHRGLLEGTSRIGVRDMLSYQSLMPAAAGTPRYEKPELWFGTANWHGGFCHAPPRPQRGTSPRATFSHSALGHRSTIRRVSPVESRDGGRLVGASRIGVRDMLSCQSLMPAVAGAPKCENETWSLDVFGCG